MNNDDVKSEKDVSLAELSDSSEDEISISDMIFYFIFFVICILLLKIRCLEPLSEEDCATFYNDYNYVLERCENYRYKLEVLE